MCFLGTIIVNNHRIELVQDAAKGADAEMTPDSGAATWTGAHAFLYFDAHLALAKSILAKCFAASTPKQN